MKFRWGPATTRQTQRLYTSSSGEVWLILRCSGRSLLHQTRSWKLIAKASSGIPSWQSKGGDLKWDWMLFFCRWKPFALIWWETDMSGSCLQKHSGHLSRKYSITVLVAHIASLLHYCPSDLFPLPLTCQFHKFPARRKARRVLKTRILRPVLCVHGWPCCITFRAQYQSEEVKMPGTLLSSIRNNFIIWLKHFGRVTSIRVVTLTPWLLSCSWYCKCCWSFYWRFSWAFFAFSVHL